MSERRGFLGHLRTVLVVTLITLMVWLLAESRMVRVGTIEAQVLLTRTEPDGTSPLVLRQAGDEPAIRTASITLEGSAAGLDRFARLLQNRVELRLGREIPPRPGVYTVDLEATLRQSQALAIPGVTITDVNPEALVIEVDEVRTREFPVRVLLPEGVQTDGPPRAEPPAVTVRAPAGVLGQLQAGEAFVRIEPSEIAQLAPGRLETIPGAVVQINGLDEGAWATEVEPGQVDVLLALRSVTDDYVIERLPVQVMIAPGEVGDWLVRISESDKDLVGVPVTGPVEAVELLRSGEVVPRAFVHLTFEDLERQVGTKPAQIINLPPGCRVTAPPASVELEISRSGGEPAPGGGQNPAQPGS